MDATSELQSWFAKHQEELTSHGYTAELTVSPEDRPKRAVAMTIATALRIGQLTVWDTGEAALNLGDAVSGEVREEHREITSEVGLDDATNTLVAWVAAVV